MTLASKLLAGVKNLEAAVVQSTATMKADTRRDFFDEEEQPSTSTQAKRGRPLSPLKSRSGRAVKVNPRYADYHTEVIHLLYFISTQRQQVHLEDFDEDQILQYET